MASVLAGMLFTVAMLVVGGIGLADIHNEMALAAGTVIPGLGILIRLLWPATKEPAPADPPSVNDF